MSIKPEEAQERLLYLLINQNDLIADFFAKNISASYFSDKYKPLFYALSDLYREQTDGGGEKIKKLTENIYLDFIKRSFAEGDYNKWIKAEVSGVKFAEGVEKAIFYNVSNLQNVDPNDYEFLVRLVREHHIKERSSDLLEKFGNKSKIDFLPALVDLNENISSLISDNSSSSSVSWVSVDDYADNWYEELEKEILNPAKVLSTGIKEFDETINVGLDIGSLTLIVADVGGFKSTTMMNIALNVCKQSKENVLYVSLEMPKKRLMQKIIAREARVDSKKISQPANLSKEEKEKLRQSLDTFKNLSSKFVILDAEERTTVSAIRAEIEKRKSYFKPRLVVIDYISILMPDGSFAKLQEHSWYGQMCKSLRSLGRKMGFAVLSAVQLNREAIKSLRNQKDGKASIGSDSLKGSHDFSADSDNIFIQMPHNDLPDEKLGLFCVKARYGQKQFSNGKQRVDLNINPKYGLVESGYMPVGSVAFTNDVSANDTPPDPDVDLSFESVESVVPQKITPNKSKYKDNVLEDLGL